MYVLFLDESGVKHRTAPFVLAGLAVHELDAPHLAKRLEGNLTYRLAPLGLNARDFELHATDIWRGDGDWKGFNSSDAFKILGSTYRALMTYDCVDPEYSLAFFGAVVDHIYGNREERAYDLVLNKFDEMLDRNRKHHRRRETGLVIHDRRVVVSPIRPGRSLKGLSDEERIQSWSRDWQEVAGRAGRLNNLADVPFFGDSRASRLLQAADFVTWALWRSYGPAQDSRWLKAIEDRFDAADGNLHGLIHVSPDFARRTCPCIACQRRLVT